MRLEEVALCTSHLAIHRALDDHAVVDSATKTTGGDKHPRLFVENQFVVRMGYTIFKVL